MGRTVSNDPLQRFRFKVEVNSVEFGCKTISGLEKEVEVVEYREGGYKMTHKLPGIPKTGVLTIEKAAFQNMGLYAMIKDTIEQDDFRFSCTIIEQDRLGQAKRQWILEECFVSKITAPELDAESSEVSIEQIEVQYEDMHVEVL